MRAVGYVNNKADNERLAALADGFNYRIEHWREAVRDKFNAALGGAPYAGVLSALAIGDQSSIPHAQWQVFTRTGVNHLMSISGLHITMLASLGFALTYWLWRRSTRLTLLAAGTQGCRAGCVAGGAGLRAAVRFRGAGATHRVHGRRGRCRTLAEPQFFAWRRYSASRCSAC